MNAPIGIVERLGKKKLNKVDVLPLGGISNHINWMCNESDKNILYKADKYGFNNNNHNYLDKKGRPNLTCHLGEGTFQPIDQIL